MSCTERAIIDRHFALDAGPGDEAIMRAHLLGCEACRAHYERHLLLAQLDPKAPSVEDRLASGLGLPRPRRVPVSLVLTVFTLSVASVLLFAGRARRGDDAGFAARGGPVAPAPALSIYCTSCGKPSLPLGETVPATATLAFAYRNPEGRKRLMVVAADDRKQVYWYHPDPVRNPSSVPIEPAEGLRELPEEVTQTFAGDSLVIVGLFSDEPLFSGQVESLLDTTGCASVRSLGATCVETRVAVRREKPR
jgi:hypothetical protein